VRPFSRFLPILKVHSEFPDSRRRARSMSVQRSLSLPAVVHRQILVGEPEVFSLNVNVDPLPFPRSHRPPTRSPSVVFDPGKPRERAQDATLVPSTRHDLSWGRRRFLARTALRCTGHRFLRLRQLRLSSRLGTAASGVAIVATQQTTLQIGAPLYLIRKPFLTWAASYGLQRLRGHSRATNKRKNCAKRGARVTLVLCAFPWFSCGRINAMAQGGTQYPSASGLASVNQSERAEDYPKS